MPTSNEIEKGTKNSSIPITPNGAKSTNEDPRGNQSLIVTNQYNGDVYDMAPIADMFSNGGEPGETLINIYRLMFGYVVVCAHTDWCDIKDLTSRIEPIEMLCEAMHKVSVSARRKEERS